MSTKSKHTAELLKEIGIRHFALHGYSGASLSMIAKEAHIQKPSIYAHFSSKEELFYACMRKASDDTFSQMRELLNRMQQDPAEKVLYAFLNLYDYLCDSASEQDFCLLFHTRFAYFPPEEIRESVIEHSNDCIKIIGDILAPIIKRWAHEDGPLNCEIEEVQTAFICLYDGLMVERLLGDKEKFQFRLKHSWSFFKKAWA